MVFRILSLLLLPVICLAQINSNGEKPTGELLSNERSPIEMKRNASFNLEEIKVRWKKAALENCAGVTCAPAFSCGTSTITDIDENEYPTVKIGAQCWTQSNLKVTKYNDGTAIPYEASDMLWYGLRTGAHSADPGLPSYKDTYGYLYNGYAAAGIITIGGTSSKNICPMGWHVPNDVEWSALVDLLGGSSAAGGKMKSTSSLWNNPNGGADNFSGFTALPGGYRTNAGTFFNIGNEGYFWSVTSPTIAAGISVFLFAGNVYTTPTAQFLGYSVRCLKD
jgi:uncharacterized protein (TIGR02145 family)